MLMRPGRRGRDRGAAAVEFALVMPVLFMLLMGIVNYGLWFNDSLQLRQGIRESVRQAVVQYPKSPDTCATSTFTLDSVVCETRAQLGPPTDVTYVYVSAPGGWQRGQSVYVCGAVVVQGFSNFVPLPAGGLLRSKTRMSIESDTPAVTLNIAKDAGNTTLPTIGDWRSWCTTP